MSHKLHQQIGKLIEDVVKNFKGLTIFKDPACCGGGEKELQHIPLFCKDVKNRGTRYCCVDMLILQGEKVRIIVEIEESDIKPTQVCGKFLSSALSNYYIHDNDGTPKEMAESVAFIQVLDSSKLKDRSAKLDQFSHLEKSIQDILPLTGSRVKKYELFTGTKDDCFDEMIDFIKDELK